MKLEYREKRLYDDNDLAVKLAYDKFVNQHPREKWPEWLVKCLMVSGTKKSKNIWIVDISIATKPNLKSNQHWEEINGIPIIIDIDEITGQKSVVICNGPPDEVEILFEVEINIDDQSLKVLKSVDMDYINGLDGTKYGVCR